MRTISKTKIAGFTALFVASTVFFRPTTGTALVSVGYTSEKACFSVKFHNETSAYNVTPLFLLPGEDVSLEMKTEDPADSFSFSNASWKESTPGIWSWTAPTKTGLYPVTITEARTGETMVVNAFVMVPFNKVQQEAINGYKIGRYPPVPASRTPYYALPRGFVEVTPENKDTYITPHFKLGQFLCKQEGRYPKYIVLREKLLMKLEFLLEHVNAEGIPARSFSVMSGYRTPYYNRALRNVRYSRHMWGDAADIFIANNPNDNYMDDLNGDGKRDVKDAEFLSSVVDDLQDKPSFKDFIGGLGSYRPTESHGPFIHVDARGFESKWRS